MVKMWRFILTIATLATVNSSPIENSVAENFVGAVSECIDGDTTLCLKEKAYKLTERLAVAKSLDIFEGVSLISTGSARSSRSYEQLAEDSKARETQLEERIANNVGDFLDNHVLQLSLSDESEGGRDLDAEGRGKKKKKIKQLLPLLLLLKVKLAALVPLFLGIIAFVAVKAVFLGKIAFAMQAFNLIRKLLSKNNQSSGVISYAASPQHHDDNQGYSYEPPGGWSRKVNDAQSLAYSGQLGH